MILMNDRYRQMIESEVTASVSETNNRTARSQAELTNGKNHMCD